VSADKAQVRSRFVDGISRTLCTGRTLWYEFQ